LATGSGGRGNHALFGKIRDPAENWQDERVRLLKLLEDNTGTVKLLTDEREKLVDVGRFRCLLPRSIGANALDEKSPNF
jgi:hypothetical protein